MTAPSSSSLRFDRNNVPSCRPVSLRHRRPWCAQTYPFLGQLACLFVLPKIIVSISRLICQMAHLGVSQQLQYSSFIWGESRDLANNGPHKCVFGGLDPFPLTWAGGLGKGRGRVAFVRAITEVYLTGESATLPRVAFGLTASGHDLDGLEDAVPARVSRSTLTATVSTVAVTVACTYTVLSHAPKLGSP